MDKCCKAHPSSVSGRGRGALKFREIKQKIPEYGQQIDVLFSGGGWVHGTPGSPCEVQGTGQCSHGNDKKTKIP